MLASYIDEKEKYKYENSKYKLQMEDLSKKLEESQAENYKFTEKFKHLDEKNNGLKIVIQNMKKSLKEKDIEVVKHRESALVVTENASSSKDSEVKIEELNKTIKTLKTDIE